jgi:DNA-binding SARP family transcriptional activator
MAAHVQGGQVRVELLGAFRVVVDGMGFADTVWPSRRSAELVQLVALSERRCLQREQVIEALWAHLELEAGAANLRKAAHHARQALNREDAVVLSGGRVALFPSA